MAENSDQDRKANGLLFAGLATIGAGLVMLTMPVPSKPTSPPTPVPGKPPPPGPPPPPPPAPAPSGGRTVTVCGCNPDAAGNCTTWCSTLWGIAQRFYGNGALYPRIYAANAALIEATARAHGFASSQGGHWIWPGMVLTVP